MQERAFLQTTPMGDLVILTLEGEDPERSFREIMSRTDPFTVWFLARVKAIHGLTWPRR